MQLPTHRVDDFSDPFLRQVFSAKKITRTAANPTLNSAKSTSESYDAWRPAIEAELNLLRDLECYEEVRIEDVPALARRNIIPTKMDLKTKFFANGEINKLKARLVVLGLLEKLKENEQNYSPTAG